MSQEITLEAIKYNEPDPRKLNVFLDLDNTLLSAVPLEEMDWSDDNKKKAKDLTFHNMEDYYVIFERPGVQEFLDYLFANYNVNVWSAASKDYVAFIVKEIIQTKPSRKLGYTFFSYHCSLSKKLCNKGIKDLRLIWEKFNIPGFDEYNTIIIDDLNKVKTINGDNCLAVPEFEFEDEKSEEDNLMERLPQEVEACFKNLEKKKDESSITYDTQFV
jgi:TFIIF-interacting CTD phosphatase-like protein